jgi:peptidyl-prolyl cis-trans isomerase D
MSIIQTIRDKGAKVSVVLIALALVGFILTDYFSGKNRGGFSRSETVGRVNGRNIGFDDFNKRMEQMEANIKQQAMQYGQNPEQAVVNAQALEETWNQEISRMLLIDEFEKIGMQIGKKELGDILYGPNAPQDLQRQFTDEATGKFNAALAKQNIDQMLKKGTEEQKANINNYINELEQFRKTEKYYSLLSNSVNYPRWFVEKQNADNSQIANISMVREVYASIPDSTIKISDKEINDFISKHKEDFKQEESRSIEYVSFSASPSAADSADVKNRLLGLKEAFDSTNNMEQFLTGEGVGNYYNGYISGKTIQIAVKDSIFRTPVGSVYGPYLDGNSYVLAKLEGVRTMPDTVKVRHILVATMQRDQQSGQMYPVRDSSTAKKLIDSIQTALRSGSNFDTLCVKLSDDPGSKDKGGVYENVPSGQMVAPFNDFIFLNPTGSKGIVKTDFGYHYIEILSQKGNSAAYKIAYLPKEIFASQETDNKAQNDANLFAADSRDIKSFNEGYEKTLKPQGIIKGIASNITRTGSEIRGVGYSRNFVRSIYDAKRGEVLKPERIDDNYVVAVITEVFNKGTQSASQARNSVEPLLRNKKKAEALKQKIGKVSTLEAVSQLLNNIPIEKVDSLRMSSKNVNAKLGFEPRVVGAAFNPANKGKVVPEVLEGGNGVYVIRVESVAATPSASGSVADQRKLLADQAKQYLNNQQSPANPVNALKKAASITDKRADRY